MSTNSNKPAKTSPLADAVAGQPASSQPKTTSKRKAPKAQKPQSASSRTVEAVKSAAKAQAKSDAAAILNLGEQVYAHELEKELRSLMGGATEDYFRAPVESWTLPYAADTEQLETVEVAALPSQN